MSTDHRNWQMYESPVRHAANQQSKGAYLQERLPLFIFPLDINTEGDAYADGGDDEDHSNENVIMDARYLALRPTHP